MKLRDFVANSLPRVRGRKKKGQTANGTAVSITAAVVAATTAAAASKSTTTNTTTSPAKAEVLSPTSPRSSGRQDGNGNWFQFGAESRFGFLEKLVGKESPVKRLFENKSRHVVAAPKCDKRQSSRDNDDDDDVIKTTSSPRYCPSSAVTEPSSPYGSVGGGVRSPPLGEKPVFHSQHASPVCGSWAVHERYSDWDCSSFYAVGRGGYPESVTSFESSTPGSQRGPRSRSRIRTNPWLPSPRPSPYSVRSLSSPCPSSRSQSPSSSPAPPSSSDSTSPLTSFSSDVSATCETQLHRHRRHRRHHSEVKASDLKRHIAFDAHLTDTEQYYSTLDSGIGDIATSSSEKDKHKVTTSRKQRNLNTKRRSVDRDSELIKTFTITASSSSSPKSKPKFRVKTRSSCPSSSKALIANRDSKFWDSDSSSRSPPTRSRSLGNSKDSLHFETTHAENCVGPERGRAVAAGSFGEAVLSYLPAEFLYEADSVDLYPASSAHEPSVLSPCDDICVITSNIEQLAQNISSEYEESADVSLESTLDSLKQDDRSDSLKDLYNIDSEETLVLQSSGSGFGSVLDYASFAEPLQCRESLRTESRDDPLDNSLTDAPHQHAASPEELLLTVDVAVQTDFVDDEEEDNSGSDWLASTESSSDWVTSNGSGSDWLASGGSDWQTGEGSGCATEEEEEEEEEEESTLWVEGSRLWIVPDIMQNSTDTGYSSLSRDGRIVTDDNNNNSNNNNNNNSNTINHNNNTSATNAEDSSDSTTTTDEKMSKASDSDVTSQTASDSTKSSDIVVATGAVPKRTVIRKLPKHKPSSEVLKNGGDLCSQRISCTFEFNIMGGKCSKKSIFGNGQSLCSSESKKKSEHCSCDAADFFSTADRKEDALPEQVHKSCRQKVQRRSNYDHVVPYPYDVTRFSDVILPPDERARSVSPCVLHDQLASRSDEAKEQDGPFQLPSTIFTSTPRNHGSVAGEEDEEDFCTCLDTSMASEKNDATDSLSTQEEGNSESCRSSKLALVPSPRRFLPSRLLEDLPSTGRNLQQVKASLEDKVQFLRQGKRIVSRKIREAREEEMVRQQQKLRFQRLLDIHRKRILLETLQDLRQRLESQSARLQASYSAVLDLQKRYV